MVLRVLQESNAGLKSGQTAHGNVSAFSNFSRPQKNIVFSESKGTQHEKAKKSKNGFYTENSWLLR